jgi:hypothetical protein
MLPLRRQQQKRKQWFSFWTSHLAVNYHQQIVSVATQFVMACVVQFLHNVVEAVNDALLFRLKAARMLEPADGLA